MMFRSRRGATTVEMALVGIPVILTLISVFEMARGMWMYHTLSYAVKTGVRFAIVHGQNCVTVPGVNPNNCAKTIADVAAVIQNAGVGLDPSTTQLTFSVPPAAGIPCFLAACASNTTTWPPVNNDSVHTQIRIDIQTPFRSALAMFWPGSKPVSFAVVNFGASSADHIQF